jgi:hypothetical protein
LRGDAPGLVAEDPAVDPFSDSFDEFVMTYRALVRPAARACHAPAVAGPGSRPISGTLHRAAAAACRYACPGASAAAARVALAVALAQLTSRGPRDLA